MSVARRVSTRSQRGVVLVFCYLCVAMLLALGTAALRYSLNEQGISLRHVRMQSAFEMAEAGLDQAIAELSSSAAWTGASYTTVGSSGGYAVTVTSLSSALRSVVSTGYYPSNDPAASGYQTKQVEAVVSVQSSDFDYALFAASTINMDKTNLIDSYDSAEGAYGDENIGTEGNIGSNAVAAGTITLGKNAIVSGDVVIGPGGDVSAAIVLGSGAQITGSQGTLLAAQEMESATLPAGSTSTALSLGSGLQQTLAAGTYRYTHIELGASASLLVSGDVTIVLEEYLSLDRDARLVTTCATCAITLYIDGDDYEEAPNAIQLGQGALLSANSKPAQFKIYVTGTEDSARTVQMDQSSQMHAALHAPLSALSMDQSSQLFGAAIAHSIQMDQLSKVHFDEALASSEGSDGAAQLQSWREP